jgi:F-type H+-transporting ATPase subunit delta
VASFVGIYARALADVVVDRKLDASRIGAQLESVGDVLNESSELRTVWDTPAVSNDQKLNLLDALAKQIALSREVRNFIAVLISNRRMHAFPEIARQAIEQINDQLGLADADVVSTRELGAEEKRKLESQVAKATGKKLRVRYSLDQKLMGGVIVKVGSTIYDGSVRGQLKRLREQLTAIQPS